jgi:pimeloyl-ACP methyl ester carboxylesterase
MIMIILQGARDLQCPPAQGQNLAQRIPGAQYEFFPKAGHGVLQPGRPDAAPEDWARAVEVSTAFVERVYAHTAQVA